MLRQAIPDRANPAYVEKCHLAQFCHLGFQAELIVKHHPNVASDGSRSNDAVSDTVFIGRAWCSDHKHFCLIVIQVKPMMIQP